MIRDVGTAKGNGLWNGRRISQKKHWNLAPGAFSLASTHIRCWDKFTVYRCGRPSFGNPSRRNKHCYFSVCKRETGAPHGLLYGGFRSAEICPRLALFPSEIVRLELGRSLLFANLQFPPPGNRERLAMILA